MTKITDCYNADVKKQLYPIYAVYNVNRSATDEASTDRLSIRPWRSYDFKMESDSLDEEEFRYLYVPRNSIGHEPHTMSSEFWNHELQAIDTTNEEDVLEFVQSYGIPFSPFYNSKERFLSGQYASKSFPVPDNGMHTYREIYARINSNKFSLDQVNQEGFISDDPTSNDPHRVIRSNFFRVRLNSFIDKRYLYEFGSRDILWGCYASEYARHNCYASDQDHLKYGGIISLPEIQTTLRIYQMMFPLIALEHYARKNYVSIDESINYFYNKKYVNQNGRKYFFIDLHSDNETADIKLKTHAEKEALAKKWLNEDKRFHCLEDALKAVEICEYTDLGDSLRDAMKNANYFFQISSTYIFDKNKSFFSRPYYSRDQRKKNIHSFLATILDNSSMEEKVINNQESGSLDEAIYTQFLFEQNLEIPWKQCAYCGRIFKLYKETNLSTARSIRNSTYCKRSCSTMAGGKKK